MYHCHIRIYITGDQGGLFEVMKKMSPLTHFTHEFLESERPDKELTAKADVILAALQGADIQETLHMLVENKNSEAELILLVGEDQMHLVKDSLTKIKDIWRLPMSEEEMKFRFLRWQQTYKMSKDFWQTSNYLDATINSVPDLIWFKDKEGAHKKVNESFCKAVNKSMDQIRDRGHYYIWDLDPEEYAKGEFICMESEYEVMEERATCVFDENVKIGEEIRQF